MIINVLTPATQTSGKVNAEHCIRDQVLIESRKRGAIALCATWIIIPLASLLFFSSSDIFLLVLIGGISAFLHMFGILAYLGYYEGFAGFNMVSEEELEEYDMEKMTAFMGISFFLTGHLMFFAAMLAELNGGTMMFILAIILVVAVLVVSSVYMAISKRFRKNIQ